MQTITEFAARELGVKLYPGQADALEEYYASGRPNWLFLAGRRSGKSLISDIIAVYESVVPDFGDILRPGETRFVILVSVRADNANLHIQAVKKLLRHTRELGSLIETEAKDRLVLRNGVTILSLPASARAGRGFTASALILDELAHFTDSLGNSSANAVYDAFTPCLATFGERGRLVITTTPGARSGIVYDLYDRAGSGELDDIYITRKGTRDLNPKVSERVIARARQRDAESAAVEYDAEFADPVAAYLDSQALDRAVDRRHKPVDKAQPGLSYMMAIDPAVSQDRYAFLIAHQEGGAVIVDHLKLMRPPINPAAAEDLLGDLVRRFRPYKIRCDTAATVQRLKSAIPALEYTPFSRPMKLRIYGSLKEALNLGNLVLFQDDDLLDELRALQIRNGVDISAPRSGRVTHDDLSDCLALCCDGLIGDAGEVLITPNPFYGEFEGTTRDDFMQAGAEWIYSPERAARHSPGATSWENCRYRTRGCQACVNELEQQGWYQRLEEEREFYANRPEPNSDDQQNDIDRFLGPERQKRSHDVQYYQISERFKAAARRRLEKQS